MRMTSRTTSWLLAAVLAAALPSGGTAVEIPSWLEFSFLLGASSGKAVALDAAGNIYVTGSTFGNFPGAVRPVPGPMGESDVFVAKYDPQGRLLFAVLFGGSLDEEGLGIDLDAQGRIYVVGVTVSADFLDPAFPFPPPDTALEDDGGFLVVLDPSGSAILDWQLLLASNDSVLATDVAVTPGGITHVLIYESARQFIPYLRAFTPDGSPAPAISPAAACPGTQTVVPLSVEADDAGNVYVTGYEESAVGAPPFVDKFGPAGVPVYSTCLQAPGGVAFGRAVAVDAAGNAYLTGEYFRGGLPLARGPQPAPIGGTDAFVTKLGPAGEVLWSTFLGGGGEDLGYAVAAGAGGVSLVGSTRSPDFPLVDPLAGLCSPGPQRCEFLARFSPSGERLEISTPISPHPGGNAVGFLPFEGDPLAADPQGNAYMTGRSGPGFPVVNAPEPTVGGTGAFLLKVAANRPPDCAQATASPSTLWPPNGRLVPVTITVTDPEGDAVEVTVTSVFQDEPTGRTAGATGIGTGNVRLHATRAGGGDGRVYHLSFTATDELGATCTGAVTVCVPHDQGRRRTCGDGGALFDSTGSALERR